MKSILSRLIAAVLCLALCLSAAAFALADEAAPAAAEGAVQEEAQISPVASLLSMFLPMILIVGVMYFLMIRPQRKKEKKVKEMLNALKVGDRVCTIGGMYGTVTNIRDENTITLALGPQEIPVVFARWAIRSVEEISVENDSEVLA